MFTVTRILASIRARGGAGLMGKLAAVACLAMTAIAPAQTLPITASNPFKIDQPWVRPLASHASIVQTCEGQQYTFAPIAIDDFLCTKNGPIVRAQWWGTMDSTAQPPQKRFYVAIYAALATTCAPNLQAPLYRACVDASAKLVGADCQQKPVYLFSATLPQPWFTQTAGNRYWLQISEVDRNTNGTAASPRVGAVDWRWSGHRSIKNCPAAQRNANNTYVQPLRDPCDQIEDDLAFRLYSRAIVGTVTGTTGPSALRIEILNPQTLELLEFHTIDTDAQGNFEAYPELEDGVYAIRVRGMGSPSLLLPAVQLADGSVLPADWTLRGGDANSDNRVTFDDISTVLGNFGIVGQ